MCYNLTQFTGKGYSQTYFFGLIPIFLNSPAKKEFILSNCTYPTH